MKLTSKKKITNKIEKYKSKIKELYKIYDSHENLEWYHIDRDEIFYEFFNDVSKDKLSPTHIKKISNLFKNLPDKVWYS